MKKRLSIYAIRKITGRVDIFNPDYLSFFGIKFNQLKVYKSIDGRYKITQPFFNENFEKIGQLNKYFNPLTNKIELKNKLNLVK